MLTLTDLATNETYLVSNGSAINRIQRVIAGEQVIDSIYAAKIMGRMVANKEIWTLDDSDGQRVGASFRDGRTVDWYQKSFISNMDISSAVVSNLITA